MKTFDIEVKVPFKLYVTVDAKSETEALDKAFADIRAKLEKGVKVTNLDVDMADVDVKPYIVNEVPDIPEVI